MRRHDRIEAFKSIALSIQFALSLSHSCFFLYLSDGNKYFDKQRRSVVRALLSAAAVVAYFLTFFTCAPTPAACLRVCVCVCLRCVQVCVCVGYARIFAFALCDCRWFNEISKQSTAHKANNHALPTHMHPHTHAPTHTQFSTQGTPVSYDKRTCVA